MMLITVPSSGITIKLSDERIEESLRKVSSSPSNDELNQLYKILDPQDIELIIQS